MDFPPRPSSPAPRREVPPGEEDGAPAEPAPEAAAPEDTGALDPRFGPEPAFAERTRKGDSPARSETISRVMWALPWLTFAVVVIALGGTVFAVAMVAIAWGAQTELFRMTARARPFQAAAFIASAGMILAAHFGDSFQMLIALVALFPLMLIFALARRSVANVTWAMAVTVFAVVWVALPFAHAVLLRDLPLHGGALLVDVLVATFFADTFAYIGGRMFGQRPLAPVVSPNKTVEGWLVGVAGGVLGFWLAGLYQDWLSGPEALLMGLCVALLAPLGDLFESAVKRDLDVKDTGRLLGPHGGLLDRLDAVLFTVVAGYYLSLAIVV